ncbi:MAG: ABC transporter permease [Ignavibacteria bacterium]|jgi:lipopolysaccharide transport system permease protein|nr:ABC transporter permease [Ignavibacteria bacterium]MBK7445673.1 ABC transporter permease [Ignavibacteria bacterium]MBK8382378.1 ABC transporter permease [Ignavibacteria bacterium]MBK9404234.1 ABC transporter permease [Ignavibacteria bacterium]MBL0109164.1 ABC transporter permease [Ignavibacteria bacterium]
MKKTQSESEWTLEIKPVSGWFNFHLKDVWKYRDLLFMFVKRDFVSVYKQTILGPFWFFLQPILTTITFTIVFGNIAKIPTDGIPPILFYMSGIVCWGYFSDCLTRTSSTFITNANIFGKVYFPRLVSPLSNIISLLMKFGIQMILLIGFLIYFKMNGSDVNPNIYILLTPYLILLMAGLGLGFGIIVSSLTTKYRDLTFLVSFGVQLLMYATPVIYPLSALPEKYKWIVLANPMTSIVDTFRFAFLGAGTFNAGNLLYTSVFVVIILSIGIIVFNRVEKTFMDTV